MWTPTPQSLPPLLAPTSFFPLEKFENPVIFLAGVHISSESREAKFKFSLPVRRPSAVRWGEAIVRIL